MLNFNTMDTKDFNNNYIEAVVMYIIVLRYETYFPTPSYAQLDH